MSSGCLDASVSKAVCLPRRELTWREVKVGQVKDGQPATQGWSPRAFQVEGTGLGPEAGMKLTGAQEEDGGGGRLGGAGEGGWGPWVSSHVHLRALAAF